MAGVRRYRLAQRKKKQMSIILRETPGQQCPAGTHLAIAFRIVDIGTQPDTGYGEKRKLVLNWELPHERITIEGHDKPMSVSKIYALSLNKKANLRKDLSAWRGRDFSKEELEGFELKNILGKPCQVTVVHSDDGRAKIEGVTGIPKGMNPGNAINALVEYSVDDGRNEVFKALPEWLRKMCEQCLEWNGASHEAPADEPHTNVDDSVPF